LSAPLKVMFLCRASASEGFGHLFRCHSLIEAAPEGVTPYLVIHGSPNHFFTPDNLAAPEKIINRSRDFISAVREVSPDILIFDLNRLDETVFSRLSRERFTVCLSPLFEHISRVQQLFHRTVHLPSEVAGPSLYAGPQYAIISHNCRPIPNGIYRERLDEPQLAVGVSMGGGDAPNKTLAILRALTAYSERAIFWIFLGVGYAHSYDLLVEESHRSRLHEVVLIKASKSMWSVLGNCHLAILAGGVTAYDAAYAGLPALNLVESPDRLFLLRELVEKNACLHAEAFGETALGKLPGLLADINTDRERLAKVRRNSQQLVDGRGGERVWQRILEDYRGRH